MEDLRQTKFEDEGRYSTEKGRSTKLAGTLAELAVAEVIEKEGFSVKICSDLYPFDLVVNNVYRVEVKSSKTWNFMHNRESTDYDILALYLGKDKGVLFLKREDRGLVWAKYSIRISERKEYPSFMKRTFNEAIKGKRSLPKTERNEAIIRMKKEGTTLRELAVVFGISEKRVKDICYRKPK